MAAGQRDAQGQERGAEPEQGPRRTEPAKGHGKPHEEAGGAARDGHPKEKGAPGVELPGAPVQEDENDFRGEQQPADEEGRAFPWFHP